MVGIRPWIMDLIYFRSHYGTFDFKRLICNDLATTCKRLVNFGPVSPEFKRVKVVHPSSISSLATFALLLDLAGINRPTEFSGTITVSVLFYLYTRGRHCYAARVTRWALPRISSFGIVSTSVGRIRVS